MIYSLLIDSYCYTEKVLQINMTSLIGGSSREIKDLKVELAGLCKVIENSDHRVDRRMRKSAGLIRKCSNIQLMKD